MHKIPTANKTPPSTMILTARNTICVFVGPSSRYYCSASPKKKLDMLIQLRGIRHKKDTSSTSLSLIQQLSLTQMTYHIPGLILDSIPNTSQQQDHTRTSRDRHPGNKSEEMAIIKVAHTVVDPGTMMVHLEDTLLADPAMMRSGRLEGFAVLAVSWQRCLFLAFGDSGGVLGVVVVTGSIPDFGGDILTLNGCRPSNGNIIVCSCFDGVGALLVHFVPDIILFLWYLNPIGNKKKKNDNVSYPCLYRPIQTITNTSNEPST